MSSDGEAKRLGEKLLLEVEVEGLGPLINSLRECDINNEHNTAARNKARFSIPELDALIPGSTPAVVELVSPPPTFHPSGAGKTSLLYLIIAHAILPATFNSITELNGHDAAIIIIDPLRRFSVQRLASIILHLLISKLQTPPDTLDATVKTDLLALITQCLDHVHIFHPQSWDALIATLQTLPDYLFDTTRHKSTHRRIHSIVLEDIDTFTWSLRASHSCTSLSKPTTTNPLSTSSKSLTTETIHLVTLLSCNTILTASSILSTAFRPALPISWPGGVGVTRLAVRRLEVLKFAPEMGVSQAEAEKEQRWEVASRGRFECRKIGAGARDREGEGFVFRIGTHGVDVERDNMGGCVRVSR